MSSNSGNNSNIAAGASSTSSVMNPNASYFSTVAIRAWILLYAYASAKCEKNEIKIKTNWKREKKEEEEEVVEVEKK